MEFLLWLLLPDLDLLLSLLDFLGDPEADLAPDWDLLGLFDFGDIDFFPLIDLFGDPDLVDMLLLLWNGFIAMFLMLPAAVTIPFPAAFMVPPILDIMPGFWLGDLDPDRDRDLDLLTDFDGLTDIGLVLWIPFFP